MSWLDQSTIRSSIGAEGGATLCFFGPPIHLLGGCHCFYPLKERRKAKLRNQAAFHVLDGGPGKSRVGLAAVTDVCTPCGSAGTWAPSNFCSAAAPDLTQPVSQERTRTALPSVLHAGLSVLQLLSNHVRSPSAFRNNSAF